MNNLKLAIVALLASLVLTGCMSTGGTVAVDKEEYERLRQLAAADHYIGAQQQNAQQFQVQQMQMSTQQQVLQNQQALAQQQIQMMHETKPVDPAYVETRETVLHQKCINNISDLTSANRHVITIEGSFKAVSGCVGVAKQLR
jgi:hypothetical protein